VCREAHSDIVLEQEKTEDLEQADNKEHVEKPVPLDYKDQKEHQV